MRVPGIGNRTLRIRRTAANTKFDLRIVVRGQEDMFRNQIDPVERLRTQQGETLIRARDQPGLALEVAGERPELQYQLEVRSSPFEANDGDLTGVVEIRI